MGILTRPQTTSIPYLFPSLPQNATVKYLVNAVERNSTEFEAGGRVLRLKQYLGITARPPVINAVLDALMKNTRVEALYIQNFEDVRSTKPANCKSCRICNRKLLNSLGGCIARVDDGRILLRPVCGLSAGSVGVGQCKGLGPSVKFL